MHSLLERQIKKHLPKTLVRNEGLQYFFDAISRSYSDFDEKIKIIQHATKLSSEELFDANAELRKKHDDQEKVLSSLRKAMSFMKHKTNSNNTFPEDSWELAKNIEKQAKKIALINQEKDLLLKNLEQQNESLNNYAHMVSHDLKSPIRNIHSLISWALKEEVSQGKSLPDENIQLVFMNLEKMDKLIDGILVHATINSKEERKERIHLGNLIQKLIQEQAPPTSVNFHIDANLPTLFINRYKMEQLFSNLLRNAIKAVRDKTKGIIEIRFREKQELYQFSIQDNGIGIPQEHQQSMFEMFKKLDHDFKATGIGLAIVKKIIKFYKGDISISSKEGNGTTVIFTINKNV